MNRNISTLLELLLLIIGGQIPHALGLELSIIHTNDFHARYEPTSLNATICKQHCSGGFSRMYEMIARLRASRKNALVLDAGDNFQGTIWHTHFGWNVSQHFLNLMNYDAITIGNHEFDDGIENLGKLLDKLKAEVVCANIIAEYEPHLKEIIKPSTTIEVEGKTIAIVGITTTTSPKVSRSVGLIKFVNEIDAVNQEAVKLMDEGCFTVIVLSHAGYDIDLQIAKNAIPGISLIVGGHTHTLLHNGKAPLATVQDSYPTIVRTEADTAVLVVQAYCCSHYIGNLSLEYDENGKIVEWEGNTIFLGQNSPKNEEINQVIESWKKDLKKKYSKIVGQIKSRMGNKICRISECLLGNLVTNAMSNYWMHDGRKHYKKKCKPIALTNAFGLRDGLSKGDVTYGDIAQIIPFANTIDLGKLEGKYIWEAIEHSASEWYTKKGVNLLQQAGLRVMINTTSSKGGKVDSIDVCCRYEEIDACNPIDLDKEYYVTLPAFLRRGKDDFNMFKEHLKDMVIGPLDITILRMYMKRKTSDDTEPELDGRIKMIL